MGSTLLGQQSQVFPGISIQKRQALVHEKTWLGGVSRHVQYCHNGLDHSPMVSYKDRLVRKTTGSGIPSDTC
jgi:hypothetical protein